jgi:hypothetical protein
VEIRLRTEIWNLSGRGGTIPSQTNKTKILLAFRGGWIDQSKAFASSFVAGVWIWKKCSWGQEKY